MLQISDEYVRERERVDREYVHRVYCYQFGEEVGWHFQFSCRADALWKAGKLQESVPEESPIRYRVRSIPKKQKHQPELPIGGLL